MTLMETVRALYAWQRRGWAAMAAIALSLYFATVLFPAAARCSGSSENRVVDLQRARSRHDFIAVLEQWSTSRPDAVGVMKRHSIVALDFVFPVVYAAAFAFTLAWLSGRRDPTTTELLFFIAPLAAALLDYVENNLHLHLLAGIDTLDDVRAAEAAGGFSATSIALASLFAHLKYALLGISLLGVFVVGIQRLQPGSREHS